LDEEELAGVLSPGGKLSKRIAATSREKAR
jgi:hypothetical protein